MMEGKLILFCKNNFTSQVEDLLLKKLSEPIDVLYKNGLAYRLAIKYSNLQMLTNLVDYYTEKVLKRNEFGTTNYNISKHPLKEIIADALKSFDTSKEILGYLKTKELLTADSSELDSDRGDIDSIITSESDSDREHSIEKRFRCTSKLV